MKIIAHIYNDYTSKFGVPHQSGRIKTVKSRIIFEPDYRNPDALRGLEEFDYIWLIWEFSQAVRENWSPMVRPPRLGGNTKKGVFATRSPFRPNPLGLSSVKLEEIQYGGTKGPVLVVSGADLMNGTPIYDIKPYIPAADSHPAASGGFTDHIADHHLDVIFPEILLELSPGDRRAALKEVLANDPRPGYQNDPERVYKMPFGNQDIHFRVENGILTVCDVKEYYDFSD